MINIDIKTGELSVEGFKSTVVTELVFLFNALNHSLGFSNSDIQEIVSLGLDLPDLSDTPIAEKVRNAKINYVDFKKILDDMRAEHEETKE